MAALAITIILPTTTTTFSSVPRGRQSPLYSKYGREEREVRRAGYAGRKEAGSRETSRGAQDRWGETSWS